MKVFLLALVLCLTVSWSEGAPLKQEDEDAADLEEKAADDVKDLLDDSDVDEEEPVEESKVSFD